jgi:hypothetical protein
MPYTSGTCRGCGTECDGVRCEPCKTKRRTEEAAKRAARRKAGECLVCARPVALTKLQAAGTKRVKEPARYCREHLAYYAARSRAAG